MLSFSSTVSSSQAPGGHDRPRQVLRFFLRKCLVVDLVLDVKDPRRRERLSKAKAESKDRSTPRSGKPSGPGTDGIIIEEGFPICETGGCMKIRRCFLVLGGSFNVGQLLWCL